MHTVLVKSLDAFLSFNEKVHPNFSGTVFSLPKVYNLHEVSGWSMPLIVCLNITFLMVSNSPQKDVTDNRHGYVPFNAVQRLSRRTNVCNKTEIIAP